MFTLIRALLGRIFRLGRNRLDQAYNWSLMAAYAQGVTLIIGICVARWFSPAWGEAIMGTGVFIAAVLLGMSWVIAWGLLHAVGAVTRIPRLIEGIVPPLPDTWRTLGWTVGQIETFSRRLLGITIWATLLGLYTMVFPVWANVGLLVLVLVAIIAIAKIAHAWFPESDRARIWAWRVCVTLFLIGTAKFGYLAWAMAHPGGAQAYDGWVSASNWSMARRLSDRTLINSAFEKVELDNRAVTAMKESGLLGQKLELLQKTRDALLLCSAATDVAKCRKDNQEQANALAADIAALRDGSFWKKLQGGSSGSVSGHDQSEHDRLMAAGVAAKKKSAVSMAAMKAAYGLK